MSLRAYREMGEFTMRKNLAIFTSAILVGVFVFGNATPVFASANDIFVGTADDATGASSCLDPDFSTDPSDEGDINSALDAALAAVDDDGDTIIICDGEYEYQADVNQHDGDLAHGVISIEAAAGAEVSLSGDALYQLFNFTNMDSVSISGIAFVDAQVTGSGAAIAFDGDALTVADCSFTDNEATADGAAIYSDGGDVTVNNCDFSGNDSPGNGAIFVDGAGAFEGVTVTDSTFTDNGPGEGAAISVNGSDSVVSVTDSTFVNNDGNYGAITIDGGGVELTRVLMENNDASGDDGGAVWAGEYLQVEDSTFRNNSGDNGGAIYAYGDVTVSGSTFVGNESAASGGAMYTNDGDLSISDSSFSDNSAVEEGGAIYVEDCRETLIDHNSFLTNVAEGTGGGAINFDCDDRETDAEISNNRFERNMSNYYGGATDDDGVKMLVYTRNFFIRNQAIGSGFDGSGAVGGAVWISDGRFYRNTFAGNRATAKGGALYIVGRSDGGTARMNRFSGNRAPRGAAYYYSR
jgi:predicted outer membrane repeat protein